MFSLIEFLYSLFPILFCVAFFTLLERKILSFGQNRSGPNKASFGGGLQPFSDAVKLLWKSMLLNKNSNWVLFYLCPMLFFVCYIVLYMFHPHDTTNNSIILSVLMFSSILCSTVFPMFIMGWASNSKYAMIGSIRSVAQVISYEVSYSVIMLILVSSFSSVKMKYFASFSSVLSGPVSVISMWFVIMLAESNRSPFDIAEGESELVSGFNVEYAATGFVLIFLSEYLSILVLSCTTVHCFLGIKVNSFLGMVFSVLVMSLFIVVRGSFPRLRYDMVMKFAWVVLLPLVLIYMYWLIALDLF